MATETNIFIDLLSALDPVIAALIDILPFPLNGAIAFLWGGISEIIKEILFA